MLFKKSKKYDLIFSLGEACSCTQSLRDASLQIFSYPYDWLYGSDFRGRVNILLDDFKRFIDKDDLKYSHGERSIKCNAYKNFFNDITFNHDFLASIDFDKMYGLVKTKYDRRIRRLLFQMEKANKILIVYLETPNSPNKLRNNATLIESLQKVQTKYPNKTIDLLYFSNDSSFESLKYIKDNISNNILKVIGNYYDNRGGAGLLGKRRIFQTLL